MGKAAASLRQGLVGLALAACAAAAQAPLDVRVALVIGNGAYAGPAALLNPTHDAQAMARTLRQLGFTVIELQPVAGVEEQPQPLAPLQRLARPADGPQHLRAAAVAQFDHGEAQLAQRKIGRASCRERV